MRAIIADISVSNLDMQFFGLANKEDTMDFPKNRSHKIPTFGEVISVGDVSNPSELEQCTKDECHTGSYPHVYCLDDYLILQLGFF